MTWLYSYKGHIPFSKHDQCRLDNNDAHHVQILFRSRLVIFFCLQKDIYWLVEHPFLMHHKILYRLGLHHDSGSHY